MAASLKMFSLAVLLLAPSCAAVVAASGGDGDGDQQEGLTHIHLYLHETFTGANATVAFPVASPLGANSSFGTMGAIDNELRVGPDRASELVGRFQGLIVGTSTLPGSSGYLTSITFVFTAGEHRGSTLSVQGAIPDLGGAFERAVVGGTGKFRMARGYSVTKFLGKPTPETLLYVIDLFVLVSPGKY
ncbi:hypothetical protein ACP70R_021233 [Stipagrostis hirtigluma subsp. patula]